MYITSNNSLKEVSPLDIHEGVLKIPTGVKTIDTFAIRNLPQLKIVIIPETVEIFNAESITQTGIEELNIPTTVKLIEDCAFINNGLLRALKIANPSTSFHGNIIKDCFNLSKVQVGMVNKTVKCFGLGVPYVVLSKKRVDVYNVYYVEPFKLEGYNHMTKLFVAFKNGVYGDGISIKRAIENCDKNYVTSDLREAYKDITLDTVISPLDYRRITGACDIGVIEYMKQNGIKETTTWTVREALRRLKNVYGYKCFAQFVADRYKDRAVGG